MNTVAGNEALVQYVAKRDQGINV